MISDNLSYEIKNNEFAIKELKKLLLMTGHRFPSNFGTSMVIPEPRFVWVWHTIEITNITVFESYIVLFYKCKVRCSWCSDGSIKGARSHLFPAHSAYFNLKKIEIRNLILDDKWASTIMD